MTRLLMTLLLAASSLSACTAAPAASLVELALVDRDDGRPLPEYRHRGAAWVPGIPGHRYAVRLTNTTGERVLVVLSVDGVNAVSGDDADPSQAGYVLGPWQSTDVAGWRKSLDDIAQFYFTDLPDSYAARTGRPDNVGVVGVAVFEEQPVIRAPAPSIDRGWDDRAGEPGARAGNKAARASASAETADGSVATQRIGTGHGGREWSPVGRTEFVRASRRPAQVTQLRYDAPARLAALGIGPAQSLPGWPRQQMPQAFPQRFAADPPPRD